MNSPLVSVVVPTFCRRDYLLEALASLLAQTLTDFEVIVGNDGGGDYIAPVKERFLDPRILWVDHPHRKGLLGNTLDGLARSRGRYVATLHDDDRWAPEVLATLVGHLERDATLAVAFCDHYIIDAAGRVDAAASDATSMCWGRVGLSAGVHRPLHRLVVRGTIPLQCGAVFRREAVDPERFPPAAGTKYDLWLGRQIARNGAGGYYEPRRLSYYRCHPAQQTSTGKLENAESGIFIYGQILNDPEFASVPRGMILSRLAGDLYGAGVASIRANRPRKARMHLREARALGYRPLRTSAALVASHLPHALVSHL